MIRERTWPLPLLVVALALALVGVPATASAAPAPPERPDASRTASLHMARHGGIADHYIVVLRGRLPKHPTERSMERARAAVERVAATVGTTPEHTYVAGFRGFSAKLTAAQVRSLRHHPRVQRLEQDAHIIMDATQASAPWGLDRIDQRALPLDAGFTYASEGAGVHVYVIDTGIEAGHPEFGSRASNEFDAIGGSNEGTDCNGHGTHVAGIAGGTTYGVAKAVTLVGVRVLSCGGSGTLAGVIAGIDWVTAHHPARSVVNLSLGGGVAPALDTAVQRLVTSGAFVVAAAGNSNQSACSHSPARVPEAFTTAASDSTDKKASFSNHGSCVDAYAPGSGITSAWIGGGTKTISGTSMAAPAVAGVAALYFATNPAATPAEITQWLTSQATAGAITNNPAETANRLLFSGGL